MSTKNLISADKAKRLFDGRVTEARWRKADDIDEPRGLVSDDPRYAGYAMSLLAIKNGVAIVAYEGDAALMAAAPALAETVIALHAEVARLTTTNVDLLATLEGRTAPPTPREIVAHPGEWLVDGEIVGLYFADDRDTDLRVRLTSENLTYEDDSARLWLKHAAEERRGWVAIDAEGRPCAWPKVSG
jgi:hypothetical protein